MGVGRPRTVSPSATCWASLTVGVDRTAITIRLAADFSAARAAFFEKTLALFRTPGSTAAIAAANAWCNTAYDSAISTGTPYSPGEALIRSERLELHWSSPRSVVGKYCRPMRVSLDVVAAVVDRSWPNQSREARASGSRRESPRRRSPPPVSAATSADLICKAGK